VLAALQQNLWCIAQQFLISAQTRFGPGLVTGERIGEDMLTSIARLLNEWKRYSEARKELSHLSDRELADIGITRSDIDRIAHGQADR
jgi:uncharacterized protein YjiS (DUF1127 family)